MKFVKTTLIAAHMFTFSMLNAWAQQGDGAKVPIDTHVFKPAKIEATPVRMTQLKLPAEFTITPFATNLKNARILVVAPDGTLYLSRRDQGDVLMLKDTNGDGRADGLPLKVAHRAGAHGLAIKDNKLYLATVKEIFVATILPDGKLGPLQKIIGDLPDAGQHANRTIAFGPDGMLYISIGSTCNACNESNPENAALLRASPDGKSRTIFATGLRNTVGFGWHPTTGELWGMDHGIDFLGDDIQPEELNKIEAGKKYGWPHIWGSGEFNPQSTLPGEITKTQWKEQSTPMVLGYTAHSAPMQLVFYRGGSFPSEYTGDAFVSMRGSWNRKPASGYEIVRIRFEKGKPTKIKPFVTGFLTDAGQTHFARPVGLAVAKDGSLLMADDANGVIYRISYNNVGKQQLAGAYSEKLPQPPSEPMLSQALRGSGVPLAKDRVETQTNSLLYVSSSSFKEGAFIPAKYSEYAEGISPALSWMPVKGAKSYAIIMEDADSKPVNPFVHWLAWNIPASTTALPEGLQKQERLTDPDGLLQGKNSRGSAGYYGPRPPAGDPAHHYYFQVLALDSMLNVPAGADRDQVLNAAEGHILAKGEIMGVFEQQPQK